MTNREEIRKKWKSIRQEIGGMVCDIDNALYRLDEKENADGCEGCVYMDVEEWEMPCCKCKRGCKDYWRKGTN